MASKNSRKQSEQFNNIATHLYKDGKRHTALALVKNALNLEPNSECYLSNYACLLTNFGEYEKARSIFIEILDRNKDCLLAWHGYGVLEMVSARPRNAIRCFEKCIELDPENGSHKFDYACAVIQSGDWKKGFELYESRRAWKPEREFPQFIPWNGETGKKVYVWCEQGIGDCIQYARYLPWLVSVSENVTLAVAPNLIELFKGFDKIVRIVPLTGAMVDSDYHLPLMSLAHFYFKAGFTEVPIPIPHNGLEFTKASFGGKYKIGLCWACNNTSINYRERSLPFEQLLKLTEIHNTEFVSLQVGEASGDIAKARAQNLVEDMSSITNDSWQGTVSVLSACDFVISTDTSVAHLAATMGIPTVMFLARRDWWRWGNSGETTPWYPAMTIIRQEVPYKWEKEIERAYAILDNAAKNRCKEIQAA